MNAVFSWSPNTWQWQPTARWGQLWFKTRCQAKFLTSAKFLT